VEKKEAEVMSGASSSSSEEKAPKPTTKPLPKPPKAALKPVPVVKRKSPQSLINKQKAKFAQEKRASSMPNVKKDEGGRADGMKHRSASPVKELREKGDVIEVKEKRESKKEKVEGGNGKRKRDEPKRKDSPIYTSSEAGSTSEPKKKRTPDYSSSSEDEPLRGRSVVPVQANRKQPPPELKLNGHAHLPTERDPETMRDRYEELFPAYEQLSKKLAKVHRAAESGVSVDIGKEKVEKMVKKWEKWHEELSGIRMWFGGE